MLAYHGKRNISYYRCEKRADQHIYGGATKFTFDEYLSKFDNVKYDYATGNCIICNTSLRWIISRKGLCEMCHNVDLYFAAKRNMLPLDLTSLNPITIGFSVKYVIMKTTNSLYCINGNNIEVFNYKEILRYVSFNQFNRKYETPQIGKITNNCDKLIYGVKCSICDCAEFNYYRILACKLCRDMVMRAATTRYITLREFLVGDVVLIILRFITRL